jgi:hypothetical protein
MHADFRRWEEGSAGGHYNEWGKERVLPSLAVIEADFAIDSVETVCPDSFFSKFAVVLRLMLHCHLIFAQTEAVSIHFGWFCANRGHF